MIIRKPKGGIAKMIVAEIRSKHRPEAEEADPTREGLLSASEEVLEAVRSDDSKALMRALRSFLDMCHDAPVEAEDEDEAEEADPY